jgi:hypothetical protein
MPRRKHKAGYKGRIARTQGPGLPRTQAHATVSTRRAKAHPPIDDPRIEAAILDMNRGRSLTAAARAAHISRRRLRRVLAQRRLVKRKGRRWVAKDNRLRRVPVMTGGRPRVLTVRGYEPARLVGEHHHAAGEFVRTNDIELIKPFRGRTVQAVNGRQYPLETDPNALHRIAAMDSPPFHEIYEITSNT